MAYVLRGGCAAPVRGSALPTTGLIPLRARDILTNLVAALRELDTRRSVLILTTWFGDPVRLNIQPSSSLTASRNNSSWLPEPPRIASVSASRRRVDPSISVNRNVTTPEDTAALC